MAESAVKHIETVSGEKASFVIHIKCLRNSTWQGTVQWMEGKKTQNFRSALELIRLMDNALGEPEDTGWEK